MQEITTEREIAEAIEENAEVLVDFSGEWCAPCKDLHKMLKKLDRDFKDIEILTVDIDDAIDLAKAFKINAVPTYIMYIKGKKVLRKEGAPFSYGSLKNILEKARLKA
jgi:thioredoxin 1